MHRKKGATNYPVVLFDTTKKFAFIYLFYTYLPCVTYYHGCEGGTIKML